MKSFQFNQSQSNEDFEKILKYRRRKVAKQQIIFLLILAFLGLLFGIYVYNKVVYTEFDGYAKSDVIIQRAPDDLFIKKMYVNAGNFVVPGDTLFSYVYTKPLIASVDINTESEIIGKYRELNLKYTTVAAELQVLNVTIDNLRKQIAVENHNISFGLSSNSHKLDLQRQLKQAEAEHDAKRNILSTLTNDKIKIKDKISKSLHEKGISMALHDILFDKTGIYASMINYRLATDSAVIINVPCVEGSYMVHTEEIMSLQPVNLEKGNYEIFAYVPLDQISKIYRNTPVDIVYNDNMILKGRYGMIGMRTEELPEHLRSNFARQGRVSIVQIKIDEGQQIPFWVLADGNPVKIRMSNFDIKKRPVSKDTTHLFFQTGKGLINQSKNLFDSIHKIQWKKVKTTKKEVLNDNNKQQKDKWQKTR
ncbi:MAG: hypothetical protein ACI4V5_06680 [Prevotella sp.]